MTYDTDVSSWEKGWPYPSLLKLVLTLEQMGKTHGG